MWFYIYRAPYVGEEVEGSYKGLEYAEDEMTWQNWCESDYNKRGNKIIGQSVFDNNGMAAVYNDEAHAERVTATATIVKGYTYFQENNALNGNDFSDD